MLSVYLVEMRESIARACRVAWSLGAERIVLVRTDPPPRKHLYSAKRLEVVEADAIPPDVLILETTGRATMADVDWQYIAGVAVGGASFTFPRILMRTNPSAKIPCRPPCLIGDQALAIALHARQGTMPDVARQ